MKLAVALVLVVLGGAGPASSSELSRFIWLHQCPIVERLEIISRTGGTGQGDRFIVAALEGLHQRYVQCLFLDEATTFLCEASSGFYGPAKDDEGHFALPERARAELAQLGFATEVEDGNYPVEVSLTAPGRFQELAELMLAALFRGYGAWSGSPIDIYAPLAPRLAPETSECAPVG